MMKFVELKKHLLNEKKYCCYNLVGDDSFLVDSSINLFFNYVATNDLDRQFLSTENLDEKKLSNALNSLSFFGGTKIVVIKHFDASKDRFVVEHIKKYLSAEQADKVILVVCSAEPILKDKEASALPGFVVVDCNRLDDAVVLSWINSTLKAQNATMKQSAKMLLLDYTNRYLSKISTEINKLINFAGGREIDDQDVKNLVTKDLEFSVFELTENLGRRNGKKTFEILDIMLADKKQAPSVFAMIYNYFRRMFFCVISAGTQSQIAQNLGVKEFAVKKAMEVGRLFSKPNLKFILDLCQDLDYKIKSSQINYQSAVNFLVLQILSLNKN